jgi:hypothetical protein
MIATEQLIRASCVLLAVWGVLHALQWLADLRYWRDGTALGWDLQRLRKSRVLRFGPVSWTNGQAGLRVLVISLLAVSIGLFCLPLTSAAIPMLLLFHVLVLVLAQRGGTDGADKIALVVSGGTLLQCIGLAAASDRLVLAGGLWAGGQLALAYFAAGASKLTLAEWRSGDAPRRALSSSSFGQNWTAALTAQPANARSLAWLIMSVEILFPLALFAPFPWLCLILAGFFLFHFAIAVVMGLNTYPWAFLAAYPSVLFLSQQLAARSLG